MATVAVWVHGDGRLLATGGFGKNKGGYGGNGKV